MVPDEESKKSNQIGFAGSAGQGEMGLRVAQFDWTQTPIGPMRTWPQSLRAIVNTLLVSRYPMVLTWGPNYTQIYNDAYSKLIGNKHPDALGINIRITLAESWDTLRPMIENVMATGIANWTPELLLLLERAGYPEEAYFSVSHAPAKDDDGNIVGMLAVCSEVTDQVLAERRFKLLSNLAAKAGETKSVEATALDVTKALSGEPLDLPFALMYLREGTSSKLVLRGVVGLLEHNNTFAPASFDVKVASHELWPFAKSALGETVVIDKIDKHFVQPSGPWREPVRQALMMPIASSEKTEPLGILIAGINPNRALDEGYRSFFDLLSGQVSVAVRNAKAYEEERRRLEMLAELDRTKTEFFSNVSHELRTPLTLILGPLEEIRNERGNDLTPYVRENLEVVHRNSLRLLKLVNSLLDFSRIEAGRVQGRCEPTDLGALTTSLASNFRSAMEKAGLEFKVDCPLLREPVYVDRDMWEKIILNLLSNAFKFTERGQVSISQYEDQRFVKLKVEDSGVGIPEAELGNVFKRFYRIAGTRGRSFEGTGIGLSLVKELVEFHGGKIHAESLEGKGSSFLVSIPFGKEHLAPEQMGNEPLLAPTAIRADAYVHEAERWLSGTQDAAMNERRIETDTEESQLARVLIADDNSDMRDYVASLLKPRYEVLTVSNGQAALELVRNTPVDLVLTDIMMPGLDGLELIKILRSDERLKTVPVIFLSARAGDEAKVEGLEEGADDYLVKPFSSRELLARVEANLKLSRLRKEATRKVYELRADAEAARRSNRLKDEFLATLAHELRTPLNAIRGHSELLESEDPLSEEFTESLAAIRRNVDMQVQIVNDLLDISNAVTGKLKLKSEPVELSFVIQEALGGVRLAAKAKGVDIATTYDPSVGTVFGDAGRLRQALWNLLSNAIKFTTPGGRITLSYKQVGSHVELSVTDTGKGIAPDFLSYIFDPFRQEDQTTTRRHGGLGIGLSIVRHIVEAHGGNIAAESKGKDQGATFTMRLPSGAVESKSSRPIVGKTDSSGGGDKVLDGLTVLIVDDHMDALTLVRAFLRRAGAQVIMASSAREAFEKLRECRPDVLVSDIGMPEEDGYELIKRIRALPREEGGEISAAALTAWTGESERQEAMRAGFQAHLAKPVNQSTLVATVSKLAGRA